MEVLYQRNCSTKAAAQIVKQYQWEAEERQNGRQQEAEEKQQKQMFEAHEREKQRIYDLEKFKIKDEATDREQKRTWKRKKYNRRQNERRKYPTRN